MASLALLEKDVGLGNRLGTNGQTFYEANYRWSTLVPKIREFLDAMMAK